MIKALAPFASGQLGRITEFACGFRHAGMRNDVVHHSMRLFHEHVHAGAAEIAGCERPLASQTSIDRTFATTSARHDVRVRREGLGALGRCHVLGFGGVEVAVVRDRPDELAVVVVGIGEDDAEPVLGAGFDDRATPR